MKRAIFSGGWKLAALAAVFVGLGVAQTASADICSDWKADLAAAKSGDSICKNIISASASAAAASGWGASETSQINGAVSGISSSGKNKFQSNYSALVSHLLSALGTNPINKSTVNSDASTADAQLQLDITGLNAKISKHCH